MDEALQLVETTDPHLIIMDIGLEDSHGLDLIKEVHDRFPRIKMLVVSAFDESLYAERTLRAGANGYINKRKMQTNIVQAMRAVLDGEVYLSAEMTRRMLDQAIAGEKRATTNPIDQLSDRELEVFQLIGKGKTTKEIADQLFLSVHTIDTHREKIRHKLGIKNSTELMQRAVQWTLESGGS